MDTIKFTAQAKALFLRVTPDADLYLPGDGRRRPKGSRARSGAVAWGTATWDGRTLVCHTHRGDEKDQCFMALHDICHHLVAPPERRGLVNWGLGPDPYEPSGLCPDSELSVDELERDELLACKLQVLLAPVFGFTRLELFRLDVKYSDEQDVKELKSHLGDSLPSEIWEQVSVQFENWTYEDMLHNVLGI